VAECGCSSATRGVLRLMGIRRTPCCDGSTVKRSNAKSLRINCAGHQQRNIANLARPTTRSWVSVREPRKTNLDGPAFLRHLVDRGLKGDACRGLVERHRRRNAKRERQSGCQHDPQRAMRRLMSFMPSRSITKHRQLDRDGPSEVAGAFPM
jgi:hypothetical protein